MQIVGHGIDLVDTERIEKMVARHGSHFLDRVFTEGEQGYSAKSEVRMIEHLAGRFAAKEAAMKVLGTGLSGGIQWTDVEVIREGNGKPSLKLTGEALNVADKLGITQWWISISHIKSHAMASAIGVGED
ncbi:holo-ACP synthase [Poriferisphaera sp. WC338]|uniref:holo-ACP synthase n=1 Tax=Poriferisphaera sp. WC338 TaxID=3425129 RepID=UPI003D815412